MKKLLLVIIWTILISPNIKAQTYKGDIGIGGEFGGGYNKSEYYKYFSAGIAPECGYFLFNNLLLGARLGYSYSADEFEISPGTIRNSHRHLITLGPLARYYLPMGNKWRGIVHAGYEWNWTIRVDDNETYKYSDYLYGLGVGYFITENVALEGIFYHQTDQDIIFRGGLQVYILRGKPDKK